MHNLYNSLGKRERPARPLIPVGGFVACSRFVLEREKDRLGLGAAFHRVVYNGVDSQAFSPFGSMGMRRSAGTIPASPTNPPSCLRAN